MKKRIKIADGKYCDQNDVYYIQNGFALRSKLDLDLHNIKMIRNAAYSHISHM